MAPNELKELQESRSWAATQMERLRSIKLVLCLALGLLLVTPMVAVAATQLLGGRAHVWTITLGAYVLEIWSLRQIGRRARRRQQHSVDSPSAGDAQMALAASYFLVPLAVLCGRGWYAEGNLAWALGAALAGLGLVAWLGWMLSATRPHPPRSIDPGNG